MITTTELLHFVQTLSGRFSNHQQAQAEPGKFSHINIFFRPLDWQIFSGPWFYSEQSYDYDPWRPYRQGIHHVSAHEDYILLLNFGLRNGMRCAGSGARPELLNNLTRNDIIARKGCAMVFRAKGDSTYSGEVEQGCRCLIPRNGELTYLVSEVELGEDHWISRDRGFDPKTHTYRWGSEHGPLCFTRLARYGTHLTTDWLCDESDTSS